MKLEIGLKERLSALTRVVRKEMEHLEYSKNALFSQEFDESRVHQLSQDPEFAQILEAYVSRFCRLQDTVGDKLLVGWMKATQEKIGVAIDNLDRAEKFGFLESSDKWLEVRSIRNQMIHEYMEDPIRLVEAVNISKQNIPLIVNFAEKLMADIEERLKAD